MTKLKPLFALAALLFAVTILVPSLLVLPFGNEKTNGELGKQTETKQEPQPEAPAVSAEPAIEVGVFRTKTKQIEKLPLDEYLVGVVASEMPADFEKEALKAQALAARTYIVSHFMRGEEGKLPDGADVYDTEVHQVYKSIAELKQLWKSDYDWKMAKVTEAVQETGGQILTYEGNPITATFFSTSNGFTENSESVWPNAYPYLKSVESPWDVGTPKFGGQKAFAAADFEKKLGVKLPAGNEIGKITETTAGKRVGKVDIGGKVISGVDIRDKLGLKSTDFIWERKGDNIIITTKGYGHGVGMSQYGANGMAAEGKTYQEIVAHYYQGVEITTSDTMLAKVMAKK